MQKYMTKAIDDNMYCAIRNLVDDWVYFYKFTSKSYKIPCTIRGCVQNKFKV